MIPLLSFYNITRRWSQLAETKHADCFFEQATHFHLLVRFFPIGNNISPIIDQSVVFTSGTDPDILMIVLNPNNAGLFKDSFFKDFKLIPTSYFNKN